MDLTEIVREEVNCVSTCSIAFVCLFVCGDNNEF